MKVMEAQSATLTNYEVYNHLIEQETKHRGQKKRKLPGNLATVTKELLTYFRTAPSPLGATPFPYDENTIKNLLQRLRPYELTKAEVLMIVNLRPVDVVGLSTIVQEMEVRFPEEETQEELAAIIVEVLGAPDVAQEQENMERDADNDRQAEDGEGMEVDETA